MNIEQEIEKRAKEIIKAKRKLFLIGYLGKSKKSVRQKCKELEVSRSAFYAWLKRYGLEGEGGFKERSQ